MSVASIPLVDLRAQYKSIRPEIDAAIQGVIDDTAFIGGPRVDNFASEFAEASNARHCVPVANGTDAIYIALKALGIGAGDEVVTVANSWISTSETITQSGARPVFVDIDPYFHIDAEKIESVITPRTRAIIPVHLYGQPADMDSILEIAQARDLHVIEDCAQAHLAQIGGRNVGTLADAGTFSFYPGKNLGAYGDAGAIIANDSEFARQCRLFANHGALKKHEHLIEGINSRLDGIQAAVLSVKLRYLRQWTESRQHAACLYDEGLAGLDQVEIPKRREDSTHVFHLYVVRASDRDLLAAHLKANGIGCAIHYPTPLPLLPAYADLGYTAEDFPAAKNASREILSLPMYPELSSTDVERITGLIRSFYK